MIYNNQNWASPKCVSANRKKMVASLYNIKSNKSERITASCNIVEFQKSIFDKSTDGMAHLYKL